jgi:hypothetical protein
MVRRIGDLVNELREGQGQRLVVLLAAYPRHSHVGQLEAIGETIERLIDALQSKEADAFRIMHGQVGFLMPAHQPARDSVLSACRQMNSGEVELRGLVLEVQGSLGADWLDDLLEELSLRSNFAKLKLPTIRRLIDDRWV